MEDGKDGNGVLPKTNSPSRGGNAQGKLWHCDSPNQQGRELNLSRGLVIWKGRLGPSLEGTER